MAMLFRNEPLPSQRIQLNPSNLPTFMEESLATYDVPQIGGHWENSNHTFRTVKLFRIDHQEIRRGFHHAGR
jgi:hypothetical protein